MVELVLEQLAEANRSLAAANEEDYAGEDGLLYCGRCHTPKQFFMPEEMLKFIREKTGWCRCRCEQEKFDREKERERLERQRILNEECRCQGITDPAYRNMRFERDDSPDSELSKAARHYAGVFRPAPKQHGLLFMGGVGTGKTFLACCIANAVIDRGMTAIVTGLPPLIRQLADYRQADMTLTRIQNVDLLVLDDVGATRDSDFNTEKLFELVDARYRSGKPMIVTTNLSPEDINSSGLANQRIFDRIIERCRQVPVVGGSRRRQGKR